MHAKVIIIGSGPAGYTAAIYAARAMLEPVMIQGLQPGGQLTITTDVENYPGFADVIQGPWLMDQMKAQAEHVGTRIVNDIIVEVDLDRRPFVLIGDSGTSYTCDALIIATGAQARWLGLPSRAEVPGLWRLRLRHLRRLLLPQQERGRGRRRQHRGRGSAVPHQLRAARSPSSTAAREFRAERILQNRLFKHPKIEVRWNTELADVTGTDMPPSVNGVVLRDIRTGETTPLDVDGVFIAIGHSPATSIFCRQARHEARRLPPDQARHRPRPTSRASIAAGDVTDDVFRQAVTAAGMGCMAALEAEKFLAAHELAEAAE